MAHPNGPASPPPDQTGAPTQSPRRPKDASREDARIDVRADPLQSLTEAALAHGDIVAALPGALAHIRDYLSVDTAVLLLANEPEHPQNAAFGIGGTVEPGTSLTVAAASGVLEQVLAPGVRLRLEPASAAAILRPDNPTSDSSGNPVVSGMPSASLETLAGAELGRRLRRLVPSITGTALVVGHPADPRLIGTLHIGTVGMHSFSSEEEGRLQAIAERVALALEHARLYRAELAARGDAAHATRRFRDLVLNLDAIVWEAEIGQPPEVSGRSFGTPAPPSPATAARMGHAHEWRYTFVSRRAEKVLGYPIAQWLSTPDFWLHMVPPQERAEVARRRQDAVEQGRGGSMEHHLRAADGRTLWITLLFEIIRDEAGVPRQARGLMFDVTQRRQAEQDALRLAAIVDGSEDAIIGKDLEGIVQSWNFGAEKMYGYSAQEAVGRHISFLTPPHLREEVDDIMAKLARGERISHLETQRRRKDGEVIDVALAISPIRDASRRRIVGASTIAREISDLKRAERTLRATEKLAATGRLAATIAHEINNPMASVTNLLYLLQHHTTLDATAAEYVKMAQEELQRVTHIVRQMLGFYRESERPVTVNLKDVLENVLLLYDRRLQNTRIDVRSEFCDHPIDRKGGPRREPRPADLSIQGFPGEIRQVFSNLVVNAVEALGDSEASGGRLRIDVRRSRDWSRPSVEGVRVIIGDNGPGIHEKARRHIFEPFFTTKGERGTGLGLWVSEGIVRKHGGVMRVRTSTSEKRHGTCFSVFFPTGSLALVLDRAA